MKRKRNNSLNNKGFSLIELLVTIIILGILVIPSLNSFVMSAKINYQSKKVLSSTEVAKNILELTKSTSLEDMTIGFNVPAERTRLNSWSILNYADINEVLPAANGYKIAPPPTPGATATTVASYLEEGGRFKFHPDGKDNIYFFIKGIDVNGAKANALIKYNLSDKVADAKSKFDTQDLKRVKSIKYDDVIVQNAERVSDTMKKINSNPTIKADVYGAAAADTLMIQPHQVKRTAEMTLTAVPGTDDISITVNFFYDIAGKRYFDISENFADRVDRLGEVYYMFFPWYGGGGDIISIHNNNLADGNIRIIKQIDTTQKVNLSTLENFYKPSVYFYKNNSASFDMNVMTNLLKNLGDNSDLNGISFYFNNFPTTIANKSRVNISDNIIDKEQNKTVFMKAEVLIFEEDITMDMVTDSNHIVKLDGGDLY